MLSFLTINEIQNENSGIVMFDFLKGSFPLLPKNTKKCRKISSYFLHLKTEKKLMS